MHWRFTKRSERNTCKLVASLGGTVLHGSRIPFVASVSSINLRNWNSPETGVMDDDLSSFSPLHQLSSADLGYNKITDIGVETLLRHENLAYLFLWGNPITDASVEVLLEMRTLQMVSVLHTQVSTEAAVRLSRGLPDCLVCNAETSAVFDGEVGLEYPYDAWLKPS